MVIYLPNTRRCRVCGRRMLLWRWRWAHRRCATTTTTEVRHGTQPTERATGSITTTTIGAPPWGTWLDLTIVTVGILGAIGYAWWARW